MIALPQTRQKRLLIIAALAMAILAIASLVTGFHMHREEITEALRLFLDKANGTPWAFPLVLLIYTVAPPFFFPIIILNLVTAMVFGPLWGVLYALAGTILSASVTFAVGHVIGKRKLRHIISTGRLGIIESKIKESGLIGLVVLCHIPVIPFSLFNLVAGVSTIGYLTFITAVFLSLLPGSVARGFVGDSLMSIILEPSAATYWYLGGSILLWAVIMTGCHFALKSWQGRTGQKPV